MLNMTNSANIIINTEKLKALFLRLETRQECALVPLLSNIVLKVLAAEIKRERKKRNLNLKGRRNSISIHCRKILYIKKKP